MRENEKQFENNQISRNRGTNPWTVGRENPIEATNQGWTDIRGKTAKTPEEVEYS